MKLIDKIDKVSRHNIIKENSNAHFRKPHVMPGTVDTEVKRKTGFISESHMLSFALIICNGDLDLMFSSKSKLTWHEEWFLHFEMVWGRTNKRWIDMSSHESYNVSPRTSRRIFDNKVNMILKCARS